MRALAILGVNTGVGKTHVSTQLLGGLARARTLRVAPFKALETGIDDNDGVPADATRLLDASGMNIPLDAVCPWQLPRPISPAEELERTGQKVNLDAVRAAAERLCDIADTRYLLFEGAGGVLSPLTWQWGALEVCDTLNAAIWLVARDELGAMSQVRTAVEAIRARDLPLLGVILNRFDGENSVEPGANARALKRLGISPIWHANADEIHASVVAESSVWLRGG